MFNMLNVPNGVLDTCNRFNRVQVLCDDSHVSHDQRVDVLDNIHRVYLKVWTIGTCWVCLQ